MENGNYSINILIRQLNHPLFLYSHVYRAAVRDDCYILKRYKKDLVDEKVLIRFLRKSIFCRSLKLLMPDILYYIDENSITDKVLGFCCSYPGKFRETLLNLLAHMWLTQEQLLKLTQFTDAPEAFCKLLALYAGSDKISTDDFTSFLDVHSNHLERCDLDMLFRDNNLNISPEKINALNQVVDHSRTHREGMS